MAQRVAQFPQLLEIICSSAGGSLLYFQRNEDRIEGVFQEPDASTEQRQQIASCHDGAVAFARDFAKAKTDLHLGNEIPPPIAADALLRLIGNPTRNEAVRLGALTLSDAGSMTLRDCAQFRQATNVESLLENYQRAYWKPGLIGQPCEEAATLRTLLSCRSSRKLSHGEAASRVQESAHGVFPRSVAVPVLGS